MNEQEAQAPRAARTNGSAAAAILAAGIGCAALAILAIAGDTSLRIKSALVFYRPTGVLSGVSSCAVLVWLVAWGILEWRWRRRTVKATRITVAALALLLLALVLTFPPVADLF